MSLYGEPTAAMVGEKLLHLISAADGRTFTKSQDADFEQLADQFLRLRAADVVNGQADGTSLKAITTAIAERDVDGLKKIMTTPRGRKTRDGNPGEPERWGRTGFSRDSDDESVALPGRKTIHSESWGDAVWEAGAERNGTKALVSAGNVAVSLPISLPPIVDGQRANFLRQLIPAQPTDNGQFSYLQQSVRTNLAAVVAEGARKPTSAFTMVRVDDRVDTIAHLTEPIPRQYLEDAPLLRQFVDSELRYGLDLALDATIVTAILAAAATAAAAADLLTTLRGAITDLENSDLMPSGFAMSPDDWEAVELEAKVQFAANPAMSPTNAFTRRLYGLPVVVTTALKGEGAILVGAFDTSATLFMRSEARVDWSEAVYDKTFDTNVGASDFERNLIRFRAEMRAKLAVTRPAGFVQVSTGS